jgi:integrase
MATFQSSSPSAFPRQFPSRPLQEEQPGSPGYFSASLLFPAAAQRFIDLQSFDGTTPGSTKASAPARYVRPNTLKAYQRHARSLTLFFSQMTLGDIRWTHMREYQHARVAGDPPFIRARRPHEQPAACPCKPVQVNQELSFLKRLKKYAACWTMEDDRFYTEIQEDESDLQRALTIEEQALWLDAAASRERWSLIFWYSILAFDTTMSTNEARGLKTRVAGRITANTNARITPASSDSGATLNRGAKKPNPPRAKERQISMANRRGSGEGSIFQRKDGRWCAQVSLGFKPGGKPHRKMLYGKTRSEVSEAMKRTLRDQQLGLAITSDRQTVAQFLKDWLENTVKPKNKQLTYRSYEWIVRTHLAPELGRIPLSKLTPQKLQAFINERHKAGLSATTVKHINATLRAALSQAQRWQLVHQNAAKLVTLPRSIRYQAKILTPEQANQLLQALIGRRHEALFTLALTMGLRRGEILGLRWSDVDLDQGNLVVRHSLERVKGEGLRLSEPKSNQSKRGLRIPQICLKTLASHRGDQDRQRQWAGSKWHDGDFVFTTSVGTPIHPDDLSRAFPLALAAAKLPKVRFHDLRHSCASLLFFLGVHPKLVQETLGHSSFQLTMDTYSHMITALRNEVAERMDEIFATTVNEAVKQTKAVVN